MGTWIVGTVLILVVIWIIRDMIRQKKNGQSVQCSSSCGGCSMQGKCHSKKVLTDKPNR